MRENKLNIHLAKNFKQYLFNPFEKYTIEGIELFEGELESISDGLLNFGFSFGDKALINNEEHYKKLTCTTVVDMNFLLDDVYLGFYSYEMAEKEKEGKFPINPLETILSRFYDEHFLKRAYRLSATMDERIASNYSGFLYVATMFLKYIYILKNYQTLSKNHNQEDIALTRDSVIKLAGLSYGLACAYLLGMSTAKLTEISAKSHAGKARGKKYTEIKDFCFSKYKEILNKHPQISNNKAAHEIDAYIQSDFTGVNPISPYNQIDTLKKWIRAYKKGLSSN